MPHITNRVAEVLPLHWFTVCGAPLTNPHYREPQDGEYVAVYAGADAPPAVARYDGRLDLFLCPVTGEALSGVHTYLLLPAPDTVAMPAHSHTYLPA
jgi:hypothetical protein